MTIDKAITIFREIATGKRFGCSIDYFEGEKVAVTVKLRNPFNGRELGTTEIEEVADLVRRFRLAAIIDADGDMIAIADDFRDVDKVGRWLVKPSVI